MGPGTLLWFPHEFIHELLQLWEVSGHGSTNGWEQPTRHGSVHHFKRLRKACTPRLGHDPFPAMQRPTLLKPMDPVHLKLAQKTESRWVVHHNEQPLEGQSFRFFGAGFSEHGWKCWRMPTSGFVAGPSVGLCETVTIVWENVTSNLIRPHHLASSTMA